MFDEACQTDGFMQKILAQLANIKMENKNVCNEFHVLNGKLFCLYQLHKLQDGVQTKYHQQIVPQSEIKVTMDQFYDSPLGGHFAFEKTFRNIQKCYW